MAREEIKLVGSFDDQITKKLQKLNKEIANMSRSFERFNKKLAPVTKSFAKMAMSAKEFGNAMQSQRSSIEGSARAMREYSRQSGKMAGAMRKISAEREKARRAQGMSRAEARRSGGGGVSPMPGAAGGGGKSGGGARWGAGAAKGFMSNVASTAIGMGIANAFAAGVGKMKNLLMAPFTKFKSAFQERARDEMDDIKSAGGLFALDMDLTQSSGAKRLFKNFGDALRYQEEINVAMAESASSLPGSTSEFVEMNRRMTDTLQMVMEKDREAFQHLGEGYGADISGGEVDASKNSLLKVGQKLTEKMMLYSSKGGGLPMDLAIQQLLNAEAGGGGKGFKMQSFFNKFRAQFQKNPLLKNFLLRAEGELMAAEAGSAKRLDILMDVFERGMPAQQIDKMRGSLLGLTESLRSSLLDPQAGLFGLSRAATEFDAQGRAIGKTMKKNVNDMGEFLFKVTDPKQLMGIDGDKLEKGAELTARELKQLELTFDATTNTLRNAHGSVVGLAEESKSTTYLFEIIRETLANFMAPLTQLTGLLPTVFDPFSKMVAAITPLRDKSVEFFRVFQKANKSLDFDIGEFRKSDDSKIRGLGSKLRDQQMTRGAMYTLANFLASDGILGMDRMAEIKEMLAGKSGTSAEGIAKFEEVQGELFRELMGGLLDSNLLTQIAELGGNIVGGIIRATYDLMSGLFGIGTQTNAIDNLQKGFIDGFSTQFKDLGGFEKILPQLTDMLSAAISKFFDLFFKAAVPVVMLALKSFITGLFNSGTAGKVMIAAMGVLTFNMLGLAKVFTFLAAAATKAAWAMEHSSGLMRLGGMKGKGLLGKGKGLAKAGKEFFLGGVKHLKGFGIVGNIKNAQALDGGIAGKLGRGLTTTLKTTMGPALKAGLASGLKMGAIGGVIKAGLGLMEGKSPLDAISEGLASAGGSAIGAAIGTVIAPGIGTVIGALIGGGLGENLLGGGIREVLSSTITSLTVAFESLAGVVQTIFGIISALISPLTGSSDGLTEMQQATQAIMFFLTPLIATINLIAMAFAGLDLLFIQLEKGIRSLWFVDNGDQKAIQERENSALARIEKIAESQEQWNQTMANPSATPTPTAPGATSTPTAPSAPTAPTPQFPTEAITKPVQRMDEQAAEVAKVGNAAKEVAPKIEATGTASESATKAMEAATTQVEAIPPKVETALLGAATSAGKAITTAAQSLAQALSQAAQSIKSAASAAGGSTGKALTGVKTDYNGSDTYSRGMSLGDAISTEMKHKPPGSDLVIANSSETIIPAFAGHAGDGFKGLSFAELESAAGFDRMASYTDQIAEIADKTAASFSGGFGGALGGGSATLNAMEALGHSFGLITTSGHRPGDPGFHGVNRARDLSNGGGETPEMNAAAAKMASEFGSSLTELIYTPMGFSIKNGQKTGLISPSNHYHHIHVAVAEGLQKAAVFSSQQAAEKYERSMMPAGAEPMKVNLGSMTANSSEVGGVTIGTINVNGVDDPKAIANEVAEEILQAVQRSSYTELFTS